MSEHADGLYGPDAVASGAPWLSGAGPEADVVISSRVRLARNLADRPFVARATTEQLESVRDLVRQRLAATRGDRMKWVDLGSLSRVDKTLLVERHVISKEHARGDGPRAAAVSLPDERMCVMVNEEDHIRLQALRPGLALDDALDDANVLDDELCGTEASPGLDYAFSDRFGYLTACPTNVGTGIRVSVMVHLPALRLSGEIEKVKRATHDMNLAVRGYYGEGSEAVGDFFQISNQTTLGKTEPDLARELGRDIVPQIVGYERAAREALVARRKDLLADRVFRALGTLRYARLLPPEEAVPLLGSVRLGVLAGLIDNVDLTSLNQLVLLVQPAHLQRLAGREMTQDERRRERASLVRSRLGGA